MNSKLLTLRLLLQSGNWTGNMKWDFRARMLMVVNIFLDLFLFVFFCNFSYFPFSSFSVVWIVYCVNKDLSQSFYFWEMLTHILLHYARFIFIWISKFEEKDSKRDKFMVDMDTLHLPYGM